MTTLATKTQTDLIRGQVAAIQSQATGLIDFTIGSILRAVVESVSLVVLWLQGLILQLLTTTRASTSSGSDLDSWVADFGLTRDAAEFATGSVTFGRFTATTAGIVPFGAVVETSDGSQQFAVTVDTTNPAYDSVLGGYDLAVNVTTVTVPVEALSAGSLGNAAAGAISLISGSVPGLDYVSNGSPLSGGADAETDTQLRARFLLFLGALPKSTLTAIGDAIAELQSGVSYTITENFTYAGSAQAGHFSVVVDDGTGAPSGGFLATVSNVVDADRPLASTFEVNGPTVTSANVAMTIKVAAGYDATTTKNAVIAALESYINTLGLGNTLYFTRVSQIAYDASEGVTNVSAVTVNSATSDITADAKHTIKSGSFAVTTTS